MQQQPADSAQGRPALPAEAYDEQWAELDDFIRYHPGAKHRRRLVLSALSKIPFADVLDVGCGNGELISLLLNGFPNIKDITGVDLSPDVVESNRKRYPKAKFEVLDIEKERLNQQYDLVVCSEVVEHLDDREAAFAHLASMVTLGGYLLVTCPAGHLYPTEAYFGHTTHPDRAELLSHFAANSLEALRLQNWGFPAYSSLKWATNVRSEWAIKNFANSDYSAAKIALCKFLYFVTSFSLPSTRFGCQFIALGKKRSVMDVVSA